MNEPESLASSAEAGRPSSALEPPDHGINLVSVLVALAVLAALVVGIFWGLRAWFGSSVIKTALSGMQVSLVVPV